MTEDRIRELFREMRDEPVPPDSQARVRLAVAERSQSWTERLRRHWKIVAAVLVPACVVLMAVLMREPAPVVVKPPALPSAIALAEVPAPEFPIPPVDRVVRHVVGPARRGAPSGQSARQSVDQVAATVIRIETPDPDIVIVLVGG